MEGESFVIVFRIVELLGTVSVQMVENGHPKLHR